MLTRLITRLEDRATAVIARAIRNALRLEIAQLVKLVEDIHATQRLELETTADEPDYQLMLAELELDKPAPTPPAAVMQTVTFADLAQEDTAPGATSLPSLTPKQRADLKWGEHPLGLVPVNWLADRLGIPAAIHARVEDRLPGREVGRARPCRVGVE